MHAGGHRGSSRLPCIRKTRRRACCSSRAGRYSASANSLTASVHWTSSTLQQFRSRSFRQGQICPRQPIEQRSPSGRGRGLPIQFVRERLSGSSAIRYRSHHARSHNFHESFLRLERLGTLHGGWCDSRLNVEGLRLAIDGCSKRCLSDRLHACELVQRTATRSNSLWRSTSAFSACDFSPRARTNAHSIDLAGAVHHIISKLLLHTPAHLPRIEPANQRCFLTSQQDLQPLGKTPNTHLRSQCLHQAGCLKTPSPCTPLQATSLSQP